jgi:hypothetical protein
LIEGAYVSRFRISYPKQDFDVLILG